MNPSIQAQITKLSQEIAGHDVQIARHSKEKTQKQEALDHLRKFPQAASPAAAAKSVAASPVPDPKPAAPVQAAASTK